MNPGQSPVRRLAIALVDHAAAILPKEKSAWADAMRREIQHIERDSEALAWAAGCAVASYVERSRLGSLLQLIWVRRIVALFLLLRAVDLLFATVLTLAYRLNLLKLAGFLGAFTPGDDYRRLIPLLNATPWWVHAFWVAGSLFCAVAACELLRNRRGAFPAFAAAWILGCAGELVASALPEYHAVFSNRPQGLAPDYLIPAARVLMPVMVAAALWAHARCLDKQEPDFNADSAS